MSQASQILEQLRTGPKTTGELLAAVPCIVHSRVADLRAAGFVIAHETRGRGAAGSVYTLLSEPDEAERLGPDGASGSLSGEESKPETVEGALQRAKGAASSAFTTPDGAPPFSESHPAPTAAQLSLLEAA